MVFNFKRKTIIIASVVCIGVCGAIGGTVAGIYCTGQYTVSDMQTESLSQSTSAESIQDSVGESNVEESVQSQTTESQTEEKKEFIKYVEFNVTYAALEKALQIDIKSHEENAEVKISWIDLLAYLGAKYGGDFSKYQSSDMDTLVDKLQSGETMESLSEGMQYYAYYSKAYTAVLGGMVGDYQIETTSENGETVWQDKYGLIAYSPIAKNYPFEHYDDFGAQRTYGYKRQHLGHDLMAQTGTPVIAIESGIVEAVGWNQYGGWRIGIRSLDKKRYYYYAHLRQNFPFNKALEVGSVVQPGDVIGYLGHTGYSTKENVNNIKQPHLHFGMQLIFDESQKESDNEIWIDVYAIVRLLYRNRSEVVKDPETKEYSRVYGFRELEPGGSRD